MANSATKTAPLRVLLVSPQDSEHNFPLHISPRGLGQFSKLVKSPFPESSSNKVLKPLESNLLNPICWEYVGRGGRESALAVSATTDSLENAVGLAYQGVTTEKFDGMFHRCDIAHRSVLRSVRLVS